MKITALLGIASLAGILLTTAAPAHSIDGISLELGDGNKTRLTRAGIQWHWEKQWWKTNGTHIGGYWDLTLAKWRGRQFRDLPHETQDIISIGVTPVFRLQRNDRRGFYMEAGIGAHLLSELYDNNNRQFSTRFQFGDHLGFGYVFENTIDLALKYQHFSNGSIKKPNDGVNFIVVRATYVF